MKYCAFCKRINPGDPIHCQYCGRTFWVRICRHCREANPHEALTCRNCGSAELSETSGSLPVWLNLLNFKFLLWIFAFTLMVGLIGNMELLLSLLIIGGLWTLGFQLIPQAMKRVMSRMFKYLWNFIKRNIQ